MFSLHGVARAVVCAGTLGNPGHATASFASYPS